jgi:hypothetical protein
MVLEILIPQSPNIKHNRTKTECSSSDAEGMSHWRTYVDINVKNNYITRNTDKSSCLHCDSTREPQIFGNTEKSGIELSRFPENIWHNREGLDHTVAFLTLRP